MNRRRYGPGIALPGACSIVAVGHHGRVVPTAPLERIGAMKASKPTAEQIASAYGKTVPDVIAVGLKVLFCGINPSLYSAAVGQHFARPGNRFWPALEAGGFTARRLSPWESDVLLGLGCGITNVVDRATTAAEELAADEYVVGGKALVAKATTYRPNYVAFLGIGSYRAAFARPKAAIGPQEERIGPSRIWVLPNPSGLNAHYKLADLAILFATLRSASDRVG